LHACIIFNSILVRLLLGHCRCLRRHGGSVVMTAPFRETSFQETSIPGKILSGKRP